MTVFTVAPRPTSGTRGMPFLAATNCFKVSIVDDDLPPQPRPPTFVKNHNHAAITVIANDREIKNAARRREIIKKLYVHDRPNVFQPGQVAYDGKAGLYTSKDLGPDRDLHFELCESHTSPHTGPNNGNIRVMLQKVGYISDNDFGGLLTQERQSDIALTAQQILNLLLHNATPDGFRRVTTRNTMFSMALADKIVLGQGLELVRGCFASIRLAREHLLLNVDVSSAIMYESNELKNVAMHLMGISNYRQLGNPAELQRLLTLLRKVRVRQITAGKVGRIRSVREIIPKAGYHPFHLQDGTPTTVQSYFLHVHNYRLKHPDLPGILVIKKDRYNGNADKTDVIPFELLEVVEGQFYRRRLDAALHQEVQRLTTIYPENRKSTILRHLQAFSPSALTSAGLHVDRNLVSVHGRILPPPVVELACAERIIPKNGAWKLSTRSPSRFYKPCTINIWAILCYERSATTDFCQKILKSLILCIDRFGIQTARLKNGLSQAIIHHENSHGNKLQHLKSVVADVMSVTKKDFQDRYFLLLVILPGGGRSIVYEQIKRLCDTTAGPGLITQCLGWDKLKLLSDKHPSKLDQYLSNLVLKINVKLGGINFVPVGNGLEWIHNAGCEEATMVIGLDVSHPGPGIMRPSTAGMVYSVDSHASRYFALCTHQPPRIETIQNLQEMICTALVEFSKNLSGKFLPARILVYRDGLSEGELINVCSEEIRAIKAAIEDVWRKAPSQTVKVPADEVKITFVVVRKKHHIRFFPEKDQGDKSGNCPSGFITDSSEIVNPHVYDFFLQSHSGLLGTSRPGHYIVIKDDNRFSADALQSITFGLCHTFSRATRAVSIPAPVYYAHLVCRRADIHVQYVGDGSAPSSTGSGDSEYDAKEWEFYGINRLQSRLMYFA